MRFFLLLGGSVLGLSAAEAGARLFLPQYSLNALAQNHGGLKGELARSYRPSVLLGWERISSPERPLDGFGFFSLHDARKPKEPGEVRLAMVGDSVSELGIRREELRLLEQKLSSAWGRDVKIWLLATGAHNLAQYAKIVEHRVPELDPDALVVLFCLNDMSDWGIPVIWKEGGKFFFIRGSEDYGEKIPVSSRALFLRSQLYRALEILKTYYAAPEGPSRDRRWPNKEKNEAHFSGIVRACSARKIKLSAVVYPYFKRYDDYTPLERTQYDFLRDLCARYGVPLLDLRGRISGDLSRYQAGKDYVHPVRSGYDECLKNIIECYRDPAACFGKGSFSL